jgi:tRNA (cytosine49-C5)-methyltransferase
MFPKKFKEKYSQLLGNDFKEYLKYSRKKTPKTIWVNTNKTTIQKLTKKLKAQEWKLKQLTIHPNAIEIINGPEKIGLSAEFQKGLINIQEKSAMLPAIILNPNKNERILDACSAPGNKTIQMSTIMHNTGEIIAVEKNTQRIKTLKNNKKKYELKNVKIVQGDLQHAYTNNQFDKIMLDAPCSCEGVIRKRYDALKNWSPQLIQQKSTLQKKLILNCYDMLKPNGQMVYATCTFAPEENEEVIHHLLKKRNAQTLPIKLNQFKTRNAINLKNAIRIYPQDNNTEAFFITLIQKKK